MNKIEQIFLDILKASLAGAKAPASPELSETDAAALISMASQHKVLPLIFEAAYEMIPSPMVKSMVRQQVMVQTMKTSAFLQLYRRLLDAGIQPIVVKGITCRSLYPKPDHRISADEDLLVHPSEFEAACNVLEAFGMATDMKETDAYEYPYRMANNPLYVELHKNLFSPESQAYGDWNRLFDHVFEKLHCEIIEGVQIFTLNPTDHLFYLICHALKHFMHSGFGIRQVCDIVMFANHWGSVIDWSHLLEACRSVNGLYFAAAVFKIGQKFLTFDPELAAYPESWHSLAVDEMDMLEDLLSGGIYGGSSATRLHSSNITLDAVSANSKQGRGKASIWGSVFPSAAKLEARYPYLKEHPWMLPLAWGDRLLTYHKETKSSSTALESVKLGTKRVELLRQYGVIR